MINYNYTSFLNAGLSLLYGRLARKPFPWYVNYAITSRCNLNCSYCYIDVNCKDKRDPSLEEVINIVEGLRRLGTRFICLLGGEPLLRVDLDEIVSCICKNKKRMLLGINTNGTLIDRYINTLRKVNKVTISLEGDREKHDKDRGIGTYDKIVKNMRLLKKEDINNFSIQMTVSTNTLDSWEHVVHLAKEIGCTVLITEIASHPGEQFEEAKLAQKELLELWSRIYELKKKGYPIENSFEAISNMIRYSEYISPFQIYNSFDEMPEPLKKFIGDDKCPMGKYGVFLDSDGTFYRCASLFGTSGYNVHELSIGRAYAKMAADDRCIFCRMALACQINYLFSSLNPFTLGKLAIQALKNYSY